MLVLVCWMGDQYIGFGTWGLFKIQIPLIPVFCVTVCKFNMRIWFHIDHWRRYTSVALSALSVSTVRLHGSYSHRWVDYAWYRLHAHGLVALAESDQVWQVEITVTVFVMYCYVDSYVGQLRCCLPAIRRSHIHHTIEWFERTFRSLIWSERCIWRPLPSLRINTTYSIFGRVKRTVWQQWR